MKLNVYIKGLEDIYSNPSSWSEESKKEIYATICREPDNNESSLNESSDGQNAIPDNYKSEGDTLKNLKVQRTQAENPARKYAWQPGEYYKNQGSDTDQLSSSESIEILESYTKRNWSPKRQYPSKVVAFPKYVIVSDKFRLPVLNQETKDTKQQVKQDIDQHRSDSKESRNLRVGNNEETWGPYRTGWVRIGHHPRWGDCSTVRSVSGPGSQIKPLTSSISEAPMKERFKPSTGCTEKDRAVNSKQTISKINLDSSSFPREDCDKPCHHKQYNLVYSPKHYNNSMFSTPNYSFDRPLTSFRFSCFSKRKVSTSSESPKQKYKSSPVHGVPDESPGLSCTTQYLLNKSLSYSTFGFPDSNSITVTERQRGVVNTKSASSGRSTLKNKRSVIIKDLYDKDLKTNIVTDDRKYAGPDCIENIKQNE